MHDSMLGGFSNKVVSSLKDIEKTVEPSSCAALSEEHLGHSDSGNRRTSRWRRVRLCLKVEGVKHSGSRHPGQPIK